MDEEQPASFQNIPLYLNKKSWICVNLSLFLVNVQYVVIMSEKKISVFFFNKNN